MQWSVASDWTYLQSSGSRYAYYFYLDTNTEFGKNVMADNVIFVEAGISEEYLATYCQNISIDFTAYMVQGGGFADAGAAWNAIND